MAASDSEAAERPVREQLKKASIGNSEEAQRAAEDAKLSGSSAKNADEAIVDGKPRTSEEFVSEKTETAPVTNGKHHNRKRSRDSLADEDELNDYKRKVSGERHRGGDSGAEAEESNGDVLSTGAKRTSRRPTPDRCSNKATDAAMETYASPKTKRTRIESEPSKQNLSEVSSKTGFKDITVESKSEPAHIPAGSGFANSSATFPFGALAGAKSPGGEDTTQTSSSAFSSSAFGALAGSSTSGFGALGKSDSSTSVFGSGANRPLGSRKEEDVKSLPSAFGGALGQKSVFASNNTTLSNGFGSSGSAFGKLGQSSGFGSASSGSAFGGLGGDGGLTSFASNKSTGFASSSKPSKAFGASADDEVAGEDDESAGGEDSGYKSPLASEQDQRDERFYEQEIETGEEDESTRYSARAKLYILVTLPDGSKKEWRERGLGALKLNVKHTAGGDGDAEKSKARLLMRADGSHRVVLNTPVKKELKFGAPTGGPPTNGIMLFMGTVEGGTGLEMLQLKMKQQYALDLHQKIEDLQETM